MATLLITLAVAAIVGVPVLFCRALCPDMFDRKRPVWGNGPRDDDIPPEAPEFR